MPKPVDKGFQEFNYRIGTTLSSWRGVRKALDPSTVDANQLADGKNIRPDAGGYKERGGQSSLATPGGIVAGIFDTTRALQLATPSQARGSEDDMNKVLSESCALETGNGTTGSRLTTFYGSINCSGLKYSFWHYSPFQSPVLQRVPAPDTVTSGAAQIYGAGHMTDSILLGVTANDGDGDGSLLLYKLPKQPKHAYSPAGLFKEIDNPYTLGHLTGICARKHGGYVYNVSQKTTAGTTTKNTCYVVEEIRQPQHRVADGDVTVRPDNLLSSDETTHTIPNNSGDVIGGWPLAYKEDILVPFGEANVGSFANPLMRKYDLSAGTWSTVAMPATISKWSPCYGRAVVCKNIAYFFGAGSLTTAATTYGPIVLAYNGTALSVAKTWFALGTLTYTGSLKAVCLKGKYIYYALPQMTAAGTEYYYVGRYSSSTDTWTDNYKDISSYSLVTEAGMECLEVIGGKLYGIAGATNAIIGEVTAGGAWESKKSTSCDLIVASPTVPSTMVF